MHALDMFLIKEQKNEKKNIIFLDIDGVIQPYNNQERFKHDFDKTIDYLCERYHNDIYKTMDKYDVLAAFYDWDDSAIGLIKKLVYETNSYIVFHTGWCEYNNFEQMKALFALYDLDNRCIDSCENKISKQARINKYLEEHKKEIHNYIILDDENFVFDFGRHFVQTRNYINTSQFELASYLLNNFEIKDTPESSKFILDRDYNNRECFIEFSFEKLDLDENIIFSSNMHSNISSYNVYSKCALLKHIQKRLYKQGDGIFFEIYKDDEFAQVITNNLIGIIVDYNQETSVHTMYIPISFSSKYWDIYDKYKDKLFK